MMKASFDPVTLATPFFILTVILEIVLARFGKVDARYETKDTATSLTMGLVSTLSGLPVAGISFAAAVWAYQHRIFTIPMSAVWAWVAVFLLEDMTYYWFHRLSHERRVWWAAHVNHHSSQHYNLSDGAPADLDRRLRRQLAPMAAAVLPGLPAGHGGDPEGDQPRLPILDPHRGDPAPAALV